MHNYELETQILGIFLKGKGLKLINVLSEKDFTHTGGLFSAIKETYLEKKYINPSKVAEKAGMTLSDIRAIKEIAFTDANLESNIELLKAKTAENEYKHILKKALDTKINDVYENATNIIQALKEIKPTSKDQENITAVEAFRMLEENINEKALNKGNELKTSIPTLNRITGGFQAGQLITIAARPGVGKSAIALQMARDIVRKNKKLIFVSLEMTVEEVMARIVSTETGINTIDLINADFEEDDWGKIGDTLKVISKENSLLINTKCRKIEDLRRVIIVESPEVVVIDYLNLMKAHGESERIKITNLTRGLKQLATEFKIPIVILAQLNRGTEGKFPTLSDLKESGSIEEDSNVVMLLYEVKEEKDLSQYVPNNICGEGRFLRMKKDGEKLIVLSVQKNRNGQIRNIPLNLTPSKYRFRELKSV